MNIADATLQGAGMLGTAGIEQPQREVRLLLGLVLKREPAFLVAHPDFELSVEEAAKFLSLTERRGAGEPYHYIAGEKEFYGLGFFVGPGVLIPRPETEFLVEEAIRRLSRVEQPIFLEVGVGSGCISISILHELSAARAIGVDISATALSFASRNAARHRVIERLVLREANVYDNLVGAFDMIVSNPPYIRSGDRAQLQREVAEFEPPTALFSGDDGLDVIRCLAAGAPRYLKPRGSLLIEIGAGQADAVSDLFNRDVWRSVDMIPDLQGIPRVIVAVVAGEPG